MAININYDLLEQQRNFLLAIAHIVEHEYAEELDGLLNLLDAILDEHWDNVPADANIKQELEGQLSLI
jgi:hypothetical protein